MDYSLAEIDAVSKKAARGAGFAWGLSEEAGKAARYLSSLALPGARLLATYLRQREQTEMSIVSPDLNKSRWQTGTDILCPLACGALLADSISRFDSGDSLTMGRSAAPLLMVAIVSRAISRINSALSFHWPGVQVTMYPEGLDIRGDQQDLLAITVDEVSVFPVERSSPRLLVKVLPAEVDDTSWSHLNELAFRTYVPSSDASRAGAGSALSDND